MPNSNAPAIGALCSRTSTGTLNWFLCVSPPRAPIFSKRFTTTRCCLSAPQRNCARSTSSNSPTRSRDFPNHRSQPRTGGPLRACARSYSCILSGVENLCPEGHQSHEIPKLQLDGHHSGPCYHFFLRG